MFTSTHAGTGHAGGAERGSCRCEACQKGLSRTFKVVARFECDDFSIFGMKLAPHISRRHVASPATLYEDRNQ